MKGRFGFISAIIPFIARFFTVKIRGNTWTVPAREPSLPTAVIHISVQQE